MTIAPDRKTILIVEDAPEHIEILVQCLRDEYAIKVAQDGETALHLANSDPRPDLILLDVIMPGSIHGYRVCSHLKADERTRDIPVIFTTSLGSAQDESRGFALGAVDYISKPFNPMLVRARIKNHIELKGYRDSLEVTVRERTRELNNLTHELSLKNAELERHRHHLEELVISRTIALAKANEAAEVAHRASEERLRIEADAKMESRKLEAVGTLAAGIAHEFNNILGSIVGFAEMTADDLPDDSSAKRNVAQILSASFRARDLIARILAFARQSPVLPVAVNVVDQAREAIALLRASLMPSVYLSFQSNVEEAYATILADSTQIQQIVLNLCINAADAMNNHGIIRIGIDPAGKINEAPLEHIDSICLTVADSGSGMTPDVLERIFDPFFTTKAPSKGSGLGLSVVHGIVTGLGGVIEVQSLTSGSNTGTEFRVFLPVVKNKLQTGEIHGAHPAN